MPLPVQAILQHGSHHIYQGKYVMIFRNDSGAASEKEFQERLAEKRPGFDGTNKGIAFTDDELKRTKTSRRKKRSMDSAIKWSSPAA